MNLQITLPLLPKDSIILSESLAFGKENQMCIFFNASGAILTYHEGDKESRRCAAGLFSSMNLASAEKLAEALDLDRSTIFRCQKLYKENGFAGFRNGNSGPRGGYKLKEEKREKAQKLLDKKQSNRTVAKEIGISEGAIRLAIKRGELKKRSSQAEEEQEMQSRNSRSKEDISGNSGVGVKRHEDRILASKGRIIEADPEFSASEAVDCGGVLIALSTMLRQGLLKVGNEVYGSISNGFFGLRSMLLIFVFMALLRIKTPESLTEESPGELGILLGLDRAPEVKTLRRKLKEIGSMKKAAQFNAELAKLWAEEKPDSLGYLYIDGHVRPYNGRKHRLPKMYAPNRHLCMPGTKDTWINDSTSVPIFFVTAKATESILSTIEEKVLPKVRKLVGKEKRITIVFDREGWSPQKFEQWYKEGIDVITYRKGSYDDWDEGSFKLYKEVVDGKDVSYKLSESITKVSKGFQMREIRRLCDNGHQTSIVTTREDLLILKIAHRMFSRWKQENFFQYMNREYNFNHLYTYEVEQADPDRLINNPARKPIQKQLNKQKKELSAIEKEYGQIHWENEGCLNEMDKKTQKTKTELYNQIDGLRKDCEIKEKELKSIPEKVPIKETIEPGKIIKLESERFSFMTGVKMVAYRAESELANIIRPFFARYEDEARKFLKTVFQLPADIIPDKKNSLLNVRLHTMSNPRQNAALKELCEVINLNPICYPGSDLKLVFQTICSNSGAKLSELN